MTNVSARLPVLAVESKAEACQREEEAEAAECVLCCEDLATVGGAVALPCRCRAPYCRSCWDKALNAKFEQTQCAQCPTCRTAMRVDFDAETGRLEFASMASGARAAMRDPLMRERLQEQARPRQLRLLAQHGAELATRGAAACGPECVCGGRLVRTSVRDRVLAWVAYTLSVRYEDAKSHTRVVEATEKYMDGTWGVPLTCDICQSLDGPSRIEAGGSVWTCSAGTATILHGLSFDVCEGCYERHVLSG